MGTISKETLGAIASQFATKSAVTEVVPLGKGLINDTFRIVTENEEYVLQRINNAIFKDVELLQHNIQAVTSHIRTKLQQAGEDQIERKVLSPVSVRNSDKTYVYSEGGYWRLTEMISNSHNIDDVNEESSYDAGLAFGKFEAMLSDMTEPLGESIPDFHNMVLRIEQLADAVRRDPVGRMADAECQQIAAFFEEHKYEMCLAERLHEQGLLPKRICHCDTKVNNMLFGENDEALCVIDLDTVMPGFICSDYGDFMRTAAASLPEDDPDFEHVEVRMDIFKAFTRGYIEAADFLTPMEKEILPYSAQRFSYMQALRFFADYINGDTYYKIKYPEHNLVRTRNQIALFKSQTSHLKEMKEYISSLSEPVRIPEGKPSQMHKMALLNWPEQFSYRPDVQFSIFHTQDNIHLHFEVDEQATKAEQNKLGEEVYHDSCVEFFIKPDLHDPRYYNFEFNAIGCMEMECRTSVDDFERPCDEVLRSVKTCSSLGKETFGECYKGKWSLDVDIPVSALFRHPVEKLSGTTMYANAYKCGDDLSVPHYVTWKKVYSPRPAFHRPECFVPILFE